MSCVNIFRIASLLFRAQKIGHSVPRCISRMTSPNVQISERHVYPLSLFAVSASGAKYPGVPMQSQNLSRMSGTISFQFVYESPKSARAMCPEGEMRMFSGLMSRCTTPDACRLFTAATSSAVYSFRSRGEIFSGPRILCNKFSL